jgi:SAM-dependent methyltransferase
VKRSRLNSSKTNPQGDENLEIMRFAPKYTTYIGKLIAKHIPLEGGVLELGSGDGSQTSKIIFPQHRFTCIEQSPTRGETLLSLGYRVSKNLTEHIGSNSKVLFSLNCLEHIEDDLRALRTIHECLAPGGRIVLYVPALPMLFSNMDHRVGHYRRYTRKSLSTALSDAGFRVHSFEYVDSIGVITSLIYKFLPNASGKPSSKSIVIYDSLFFPLSRIFDKVLRRIAGKNLLMIGERV